MKTETLLMDNHGYPRKWLGTARLQLPGRSAIIIILTAAGLLVDPYEVTGGSVIAGSGGGVCGGVSV
jgi:hypothetical protein